MQISLPCLLSYVIQCIYVCTYTPYAHVFLYANMHMYVDTHIHAHTFLFTYISIRVCNTATDRWVGRKMDSIVLQQQ